MIKEHAATDSTRPVVYYRAGQRGEPPLGRRPPGPRHPRCRAAPRDRDHSRAVRERSGGGAHRDRDRCGRRRPGLLRREPPRVALARPRSRGDLPGDRRPVDDRLRRTRRGPAARRRRARRGCRRRGDRRPRTDARSSSSSAPTAVWRSSTASATRSRRSPCRSSTPSAPATRSSPGISPSSSPACPAEARLATAVTTGAFACTSPGDWEGFPRREQLDLLGPHRTPSSADAPARRLLAS